MARTSPKKPSYLRFLSLAFFTLVFILGASNHVAFLFRQNDSDIQPLSGTDGKLYDNAHNDERNHSTPQISLSRRPDFSHESQPQAPGLGPASLPQLDRPLPDGMSRSELKFEAAEKPSHLPLWRQQLRCPAGSSGLCDTTVFEASNLPWTAPDQCSALDTSVVSESTLARIRAARIKLRSAPRTASPLAGYPVASVEATPPRPEADQIGCMQATETYEAQIEAIKTKWVGTGERSPVGFTMTDQKYSDLIEEHLYMASNIVGLDVFFVAVYDEHARAQACRVGANVVVPVSFKKTKEDEHQALRTRTTVSKFKVAHSLSLHQMTFIFWEMDVFIFRRPFQILDVLKPSSAENVDLVVSSHQYSPLEPNIGIFGARGSDKAALVFENTMKWTGLDQKLHDQRAFCLVTRLCQNKNNKQSPVNVPLPTSLKLNVRLLGSHDVSASVTPRIIGGESFAVHVLSTTPLQSPAAKSYLSRELRSHPPTPRWFATGELFRQPMSNSSSGSCPGKTRLLAVEGMLSMSRNKGYHCVDCLRWSISWLVAAAMVSERTLVLPPVMFDFDFQYAGVYVDLSSLSKLVPWRETSFINDPRFQHQLMKCHEAIPVVDNNRIFVQNSTRSNVPRWKGDSGYDNPSPFSSIARIAIVAENKPYRLVSRVSNSQSQGAFAFQCSSRQVPPNQWEDSFLDLISGESRDDGVKDAEVVFVSLSTFFSKAGGSPELKKEGLVTDVYRSLRFCVKGIERGASKGFIGDTKLGNLCQNGERRGGDLGAL